MNEIRKKKMVLSTISRCQMVDMTEKLQDIAREEGIHDGRLSIFVPHTTAGLTINEHADPDVARDILDFLERMVPWSGDWRHGEGNSAAHVKASLFGNSLLVGISDGALELGVWQGVFFCEFDGPRKRNLWVTCEIF